MKKADLKIVEKLLEEIEQEKNNKKWDVTICEKKREELYSKTHDIDSRFKKTSYSYCENIKNNKKLYRKVERALRYLKERTNLSLPEESLEQKIIFWVTNTKDRLDKNQIENKELLTLLNEQDALLERYLEKSISLSNVVQDNYTKMLGVIKVSLMEKVFQSVQNISNEYRKLETKEDFENFDYDGYLKYIETIETNPMTEEKIKQLPTIETIVNTLRILKEVVLNNKELLKENQEEMDKIVLNHFMLVWEQNNNLEKMAVELLEKINTLTEEELKDSQILDMYIEKLDYMFNNIVKSTNLVNGSLEIECNISTETGRKLSEQLTRLKDLRKKLNTEEEIAKNMVESMMDEIKKELNSLETLEDFQNYSFEKKIEECNNLVCQDAKESIESVKKLLQLNKTIVDNNFDINEIIKYSLDLQNENYQNLLNVAILKMTEEDLKNLIISITTSLDNLKEKEEYENYDYLNNMLVLESILEKEINEDAKNEIWELYNRVEEIYRIVKSQDFILYNEEYLKEDDVKKISSISDTIEPKTEEEVKKIIEEVEMFLDGLENKEDYKSFEVSRMYHRLTRCGKIVEKNQTLFTTLNGLMKRALTIIDLINSNFDLSTISEERLEALTEKDLEKIQKFAQQEIEEPLTEEEKRILTDIDIKNYLENKKLLKNTTKFDDITGKRFFEYHKKLKGIDGEYNNVLKGRNPKVLDPISNNSHRVVKENLAKAESLLEYQNDGHITKESFAKYIDTLYANAKEENEKEKYQNQKENLQYIYDNSKDFVEVCEKNPSFMEAVEKFKKKARRFKIKVAAISLGFVMALGAVVGVGKNVDNNKETKFTTEQTTNKNDSFNVQETIEKEINNQNDNNNVQEIKIEETMEEQIAKVVDAEIKKLEEDKLKLVEEREMRKENEIRSISFGKKEMNYSYENEEIAAGLNVVGNIPGVTIETLTNEELNVGDAAEQTNNFVNIYTNMYDAVNHQNAKTKYFDNTVLIRWIGSVVIKNNTTGELRNVHYNGDLSEYQNREDISIVGFGILNQYSKNEKDFEGYVPAEYLEILSLNNDMVRSLRK